MNLRVQCSLMFGSSTFMLIYVIYCYLLYTQLFLICSPICKDYFQLCLMKKVFGSVQTFHKGNSWMYLLKISFSYYVICNQLSVQFTICWQALSKFACSWVIKADFLSCSWDFTNETDNNLHGVVSGLQILSSPSLVDLHGDRRVI